MFTKAKHRRSLRVKLFVASPTLAANDIEWDFERYKTPPTPPIDGSPEPPHQKTPK